ncbi:hypothetical protein BUY93_10025 [Mammaliicoccus fleurettii]|nr:hypothetical protein BUY93_10025 [Mammaliicoccus fleurettii]
MIKKIFDDNSCYEVGQDNVGAITEWHVDKDVVDIYRIADENGNLLAFKGFINKDYQIEREENKTIKKQLSIFDL